MAGARSVITRQVPPKLFAPKASKRHGPISPTEQKLVTQFCKDQPREVTPAQITALSRVLRRSKDAVRAMVEQAREEFTTSASFYVDAHKQSVERALAVTNKEGEHDAKALDVAARASQWALENLSAEGQRVVDVKAAAGKGDMGPRIVVAVQVGGLNEKPAVEVTELPVIEQAKVPPSF